MNAGLKLTDDEIKELGYGITKNNFHDQLDLLSKDVRFDVYFLQNQTTVKFIAAYVYDRRVFQMFRIKLFNTGLITYHRVVKKLFRNREYFLKRKGKEYDKFLYIVYGVAIPHNKMTLLPTYTVETMMKIIVKKKDNDRLRAAGQEIKRVWIKR